MAAVALWSWRDSRFTIIERLSRRTSKTRTGPGRTPLRYRPRARQDQQPAVRLRWRRVLRDRPATESASAGGCRHSYARSTCVQRIRRWSGAKSCRVNCSCGRSNPVCCGCAKICDRYCSRRLHCDGCVSCFRSSDATMRSVTAFYHHLNDWIFWLQPFQSSIVRGFAYLA